MISEHPEDGWGGTVQYLTVLISHLQRNGRQVWLLPDGGISSTFQTFLQESEVSLVGRFDGLLALRRFFSKLPRVLRYPLESWVLNIWLTRLSWHPEEIIVSLSSPGRYLWSSGPLGRALLVFHSEPSGWKHKLVAPVFRRLAGANRTFIGVSSWITQNITTTWGFKSTKISLHTVPNASVPSLNHSPYIAEERDLILMVGAANELKNPWFWLMAAKEALSQQPYRRMIFRWVGAGPLLEEMRGWVIENQLDRSIELVGFDQNVTPHYEHARIYFHVSVRENSSFACIDALRFGLPMLVNPIGGLKDFVVDGFNGETVDINTHTNAGRQIVRLFDDVERLRFFSENSRKLFQAAHSLEKWTTSMTRILASSQGNRD